MIQVHARTMYRFEHKDLSFIRKVADVIGAALDDNAMVTYVDMRRTDAKQNFKGGSSFYSFGKNNAFGNVIIVNHNKEEDSHATIN